MSFPSLAAHALLCEQALSHPIWPVCPPGLLLVPRSFVSYLGPFNKEFRELLLTRDFYSSCMRLGIPVTKDLQVCGVLQLQAARGGWGPRLSGPLRCEQAGGLTGKGAGRLARKQVTSDKFQGILSFCRHWCVC